MKGYTQVNHSIIEIAMTNWRNLYDQGPAILDKGITLYYDKYVTNGNYWNKFTAYLDKTPEKWVRGKLPLFSVWSEILYEVLSEEETDILDMWSWDRHKDAYIAVKALMKSSKDDYSLLDDQLCWFVNKYK